MKKNSGFTLFEVMIALLVIAVSLGGVIKVMSSAAQNSVRLTNRTFAHWVALNKITELKIQKAWPKLGDKKGEEEMAGRNWRWVQKTVKTEDENLIRIELSVWPISELDGDPIVTAIGFLPRPS